MMIIMNENHIVYQIIRNKDGRYGEILKFIPNELLKQNNRQIYSILFIIQVLFYKFFLWNICTLDIYRFKYNNSCNYIEIEEQNEAVDGGSLIKSSGLIAQAQNPYKQSATPTNNKQQTPSTPVKEKNTNQDDAQDEPDVYRNKLYTGKKNWHIKPLIGTIFLVIGLASTIYLCIRQTGESGTAINALLTGIAYVIYLPCAFCKNGLKIFLKQLKEVGDFGTLYDQYKNSRGVMLLRAVCYHNQTRYNNMLITGANGTSLITVTKLVKVVTHRAKQIIKPKSSEDHSGETAILPQKKKILFIQFNVNYEYINPQSKQFIDMMFTTFQGKHNKDRFQDYYCNFVIPGMTHRQAFYTGELKCDFQTWYYVCGLLGLMWPYSIWLESQAGHYNINFFKKIAFK